MGSPRREESTDMELEILKKFLFRNAMKGEWEELVEKYTTDARARDAKITKGGDTVLHVAVSDDQEAVVKRLVKVIKNSGDEKVLEIKNDRGLTALHIAAMRGSMKTCYDIASADRRLVSTRNDHGETPLFVAALHGNKDAFLCLHSLWSSGTALDEAYFNCRRSKDGETILHCAIRGDFFDLALHIFQLYTELVNSVNEYGVTPLHVLATKPSAFASGSQLGGWKKIVYHSMSVDELKVEPNSFLRALPEVQPPSPPHRYPDNYNTCVKFLYLLWKRIQVVITVWNTNKKLPNNHKAGDDTTLDAENPQHQHKESKPSSIIFPETYSTCFDFFNTIFEAIGTIVRFFGFREIKKIREEKEKHTWSVQMLEFLLQVGVLYGYLEGGGIPLDSKLAVEKEYVTLPYSIEGGVIYFSTENVYYYPHSKTARSKDVPEGQGDNGPESVMLKAVENGVTEIVIKLSAYFPVAIHDISRINGKQQNVLHLAAKYRQPEVLRFLATGRLSLETIFGAVDSDGNNALHLAAQAPPPGLRFWRITGTAFQMQWEVKWYQFVKECVSEELSGRINNNGDTPDKIFIETHKRLVDEGEKWLSNSSQSCSVVAALIATVAFASAATVPGGNGYAVLEKNQVFFIYTLSSLIALCLSSASVLVFLAILTARFESNDFGSKLPWKLLIGLSSLYFSIIAMLIAFCAGHFFLLSHRLHNLAVFLYVIVFLPVAIIFTTSQFPLYFDLLQAIIIKVPIRRVGVILPWD